MLTQSLPAAQIFGQLMQFTESNFKVEERDDNLVAIITPFKYFYDDPIILYLTKNDDEAYTLSDFGDTKGWLNEFKGFEMDRELSTIDLQFWLTECELYQTRLSPQQHLITEVNPYDIGPAAFRLIQTITHLLGMSLVDED